MSLTDKIQAIKEKLKSILPGHYHQALETVNSAEEAKAVIPTRYHEALDNADKEYNKAVEENAAEMQGKIPPNPETMPPASGGTTVEPIAQELIPAVEELESDADDVPAINPGPHVSKKAKKTG